MKNKILFIVFSLALLLAACAPLLFMAGTGLISGCSSQLAASGEYVVIETATAAVLQKHPAEAKAVQQLAIDLPSILNGTILPAQEQADFQLIVAELQKDQGPNGVVAAAAMDGITTQIAANSSNTKAPTLASGANQALITLVSNAIAAGAKIVVTANPSA